MRGRSRHVNILFQANSCWVLTQHDDRAHENTGQDPTTEDTRGDTATGPLLCSLSSCPVGSCVLYHGVLSCVLCRRVPSCVHGDRKHRRGPEDDDDGVSAQQQMDESSLLSYTGEAGDVSLQEIEMEYQIVGMSSKRGKPTTGGHVWIFVHT